MRLLLIVLAFLASSVPGLAETYANPKALLEALYAGYLPPNDFPPDQHELQSDRLNALFDKDAEEAGEDMGRLGFDVYVNAQDYDIGKLVIDEPYFLGGKTAVQVTFENFGTPQNLGFLLVNENGGWKIDNVFGKIEDYTYDLLDILMAPMP